MNAMTYRTEYGFPRPPNPRLISQSPADLIDQYLRFGPVELRDASKSLLKTHFSATDDELFTYRHHLGEPTDHLRPVGGKARAIAGGISNDMWILGDDSGHPFEFSYEQASWLPKGKFAGVELAVRGHDELWLLKEDGSMLSRRESSRRWEKRTGCAFDLAGSIGVALSDTEGQGSLWAIDCQSQAPMRWSAVQSEWVQEGGVRLERIAVAGMGDAWGVEADTGHIYRRLGQAWQLQNGAARDIAGGSNGQVWMLGRHTGHAYIWDRDRWVLQSHTVGRRIAVDSWGSPWVIAPDARIFGMVH